jgi:hypothetical protein
MPQTYQLSGAIIMRKVQINIPVVNLPPAGGSTELVWTFLLKLYLNDVVGRVPGPRPHIVEAGGHAGIRQLPTTHLMPSLTGFLCLYIIEPSSQDLNKPILNQIDKPTNRIELITNQFCLFFQIRVLALVPPPSACSASSLAGVCTLIPTWNNWFVFSDYTYLLMTPFLSQMFHFWNYR